MLKERAAEAIETYRTPPGIELPGVCLFGAAVSPEAAAP
jgi:hypothetical protein